LGKIGNIIFIENDEFKIMGSEFKKQKGGLKINKRYAKTYGNKEPMKL